MKKLKIGVVGLRFGQYMIDNEILTGPGSAYFELAAICDIDASKLQAKAVEYGVKGYDSLEALLSDNDIPVVGLFTGPVGRAEQIRKIINAGKDIMTTKPFELDSRKAEKVLQEVRDKGRIVYLNSPCASASDDFAIITEWQRKYNLGRPVAGNHACWYKNVEKADGSWYDDPELCPVAPIFRLGIYGLNDLVRIFGEADSVQVMESRIFTGRPTPDLARMNIKFKDGSLVSLMDGWVPQPQCNGSSLTIFYENGTIFINPINDPIRYSGTEKITLSVYTADTTGKPAETVVISEQQLSSAYQWDVFYNSVTTGQRPKNETPDKVIVDALKIIEAMKIASKSGKTEKV
jgi:predicted dehydrogenase